MKQPCGINPAVRPYRELDALFDQVRASVRIDHHCIARERMVVAARIVLGRRPRCHAHPQRWAWIHTGAVTAEMSGPR